MTDGESKGGWSPSVPVVCPGSPGSTPSTAVRIPSRRSSFVCALVFTSSHFTQPPLLLHLHRAVSSRYVHNRGTHFTLDFQLACISVAVHNKTCNPLADPPFHPPIVVTTCVCCGGGLAAGQWAQRPGERLNPQRGRV